MQVFALLALLCCLPSAALAQPCGPSFSSASEPQPGEPGVVYVTIPGPNLYFLSPAGTIAEVLIRLNEFTPGGCAGFTPTMVIGSNGAGWVTTISQYVDAANPLVWHWRVRVAGNSSGQWRSATLIAGAGFYQIYQDVSNCSAGTFDQHVVSYDVGGMAQTLPVGLAISNQTPVPCHVTLVSTSPDWVIQLPTISTDLSGGNEIFFPNGLGIVASGQDRKLTIFPILSENEHCSNRSAFLYVDINGVRWPGTRLGVLQQGTTNGVNGLCYGRVKATIKSGQPRRYNIKYLPSAGGVRG